MITQDRQIPKTVAISIKPALIELYGKLYPSLLPELMQAIELSEKERFSKIDNILKVCNERKLSFREALFIKCISENYVYQSQHEGKLYEGKENVYGYE